MNPKLLIYGFGAFGGLSSNPSEQLVCDLAEHFRGSRDITFQIFPVDFERIDEELTRLLTSSPATSLGIGLSSGATCFRLELLATNRVCRQPSSQMHPDSTTPISPSGPQVVVSAMDLHVLQSRLQEAELPAMISLDSGSFACNYCYFRFLENTNRQALFIHVPLATEFAAVAHPHLPSLPYSSLLRGAIVAVETLLAERITSERGRPEAVEDTPDRRRTHQSSPAPPDST